MSAPPGQPPRESGAVKPGSSLPGPGSVPAAASTVGTAQAAAPPAASVSGAAGQPPPPAQQHAPVHPGVAPAAGPAPAAGALYPQAHSFGTLPAASIARPPRPGPDRAPGAFPDPSDLERQMLAADRARREDEERLRAAEVQERLRREAAERARLEEELRRDAELARLRDNTRRTMLERLRMLEDRRAFVAGKLAAVPEAVAQSAALDAEVAALEHDIQGSKRELARLLAELGPRNERLRALAPTEAPVSQELKRLRGEAYDNLGALLKLRYLVSRQRHAVLDAEYQAEAKGHQADRLEVLERRAETIGKEQEDVSQASFRADMARLQGEIATGQGYRAELDALANEILARYEAIDRDRRIVGEAIAQATEKLNRRKQAVARVSEAAEHKMAEADEIEDAVEEEKRQRELDVEATARYTALRRWIGSDSGSSHGGRGGETRSTAAPERPRAAPGPERPARPAEVFSAPFPAAEPAPFSLPTPGLRTAATDPAGGIERSGFPWGSGPPSTPAAGGSGSKGSVPGTPVLGPGAADAISRLKVEASEVEINYGRKLGEGGFGIVYEGVLRGATKVAVKSIKGEVNHRTMQLFLKEVTVWTGLNQRNILPLLAFVEDPPLMISELVTDGNLRRRMEKLDWDLAAGARFLRDVADGMAYLHSFRVLHGDLKSLNVLVDRDTAKITDFGLAKFREEVSRTSGTAAGGLRGTIGFMAPELFEERPLAPPADVYAFAMLSFEVYSKGGWPFEGSNPHAIIRKVCDKRERPKRPEGVPDRAWELVEACWRQEPGERPAFPQVCAVMESWGGPP